MMEAGAAGKEKCMIRKRSAPVVGAKRIASVGKKMRPKQHWVPCHLRLSRLFFSGEVGRRLLRKGKVAAASDSGEEAIEKKILFCLPRISVDGNEVVSRDSMVSVTILAGKAKKNLKEWFAGHQNRYLGICGKKKSKKMCVSDGDDCVVVHGDPLIEELISSHYSPHSSIFVADTHHLYKWLHCKKPGYNIRKMLLRECTEQEALKQSLGAVRSGCGFRLPRSKFITHEDQRIALEAAALLIMGKEFFALTSS